MKQYLDLLKYVYENGTISEDRTGTGTISTFGERMVFDLTEGLPVVTTKKVFLKGIIHELLWMYVMGSNNVGYLQDNGVRIWNEWTNKANQIGKGYGYQFRGWEGFTGNYHARHNHVVVDQVQNVLDSIENDPNSRRHIISAWNVAQLPEMELPPCHGVVTQFYVRDGKLSCQMYQRSGDLFLGVPFNITFYAILTHMIAHVKGLKVDKFIHVLGDAHIYLNHTDQVEEQLSRKPKELPTLWLNPEVTDFNNFTYDDIKVEGYEHHPAIKGKVSV